MPFTACAWTRTHGTLQLPRRQQDACLPLNR
jgi:hypothetical protein